MSTLKNLSLAFFVIVSSLMLFSCGNKPKKGIENASAYKDMVLAYAEKQDNHILKMVDGLACEDDLGKSELAIETTVSRIRALPHGHKYSFDNILCDRYNGIPTYFNLEDILYKHNPKIFYKNLYVVYSESVPILRKIQSLKEQQQQNTEAYKKLIEELDALYEKNGINRYELIIKSFEEGNKLDSIEIIQPIYRTEFYDAVDKWIAFSSGTDSVYMAGFIYIDPGAGFTFRLGTLFTIEKDSLKKLPQPEDSTVTFIQRLKRNTADVAIISEEGINQLNLPKIPDWLKFYKPKEPDSLHSYLVKIGYFYNSVGASSNAFEPLLKVYEKEPHFKGLEFELAYAYNATKNFDKAIDVLNKAIKNDPENIWFYKELSFSLLYQDKLDEAEKICLQGIKLPGENLYKAEMTFNIAYIYFLAKNKPKFEEWEKLTKEYSEPESIFHKHLNNFKENWEE